MTNKIDREQLKTVAIYLAAAANACAKFEEQPDALKELRLLTLHYAQQCKGGAA